MIKLFTKKGLALTLLALAFAVSGFAQVTTSSLSGRVVDQNGEPVPGVAVIATHEPSGTNYGVVTNNDGRYTINGMRTGGPYNVEVSSLGYQTATYTGITLKLAETYSLNATINEESLQLGEAVVIATPASKFTTEKTGASTNINNSQIEALPTISRSITDVTKLSPYGGNGMTFAGADGRTANFTVDGANFNNNFGLSESLPGGGNPISIDAIEEMQVVISPYDVRQNNFIGGGVNAITKSGTNTLKGSAYIYHRNENMRGNSVSGTEISAARELDRTTTYGFTLGGPIVKNKLFFFVNYEKSVIPTVVNSWRASETPGTAGDADHYISRTYMGDLKAVSDFVKQKYGYDTGSWTDFPAEQGNDKILARIDWNITDKHHLALRYNRTVNSYWQNPNASSSNAGQRTTESRVGLYGFSYANSMYQMNNYANTFAFDLNSRLSNRLSNQLLVTYSDLSDLRGSASAEFPFIDILDGGMEATGDLMPYISLGYELFTWKNAVHNKVLSAKDDITYYAGDHKIMAGLGYDYQLADNAYMRNGTGYYRYNSVEDFLNQAAPETVALTYGYDGDQDPASRVRFHKLAAYLQDEWNPNEKLKLTAGLRLETILFDNQDLMTNQKIYDTDYNGLHVDTGKWPTPKLMFNPRIGFTYDVLGDHSLKIRGGTGIFTGRLPLVFFTNMPSNAGLVQMVSSATTRYADGAVNASKSDLGILNAFAGKFYADKGELLDYLHSLDPEKYPLTVSPEDGTFSGSVAAVDPKFKMPQVWKTSLAVDYAFPTAFPMSITGEVIFNKTLNATRIQDINMKDPSTFSRLNGADDRHLFPSDYTYNPYSIYYLTNTNKGYGGSASVQFNIAPVEGLSISSAYTRTVAKELTGMPGSDASSAFTYIPTVDGPNNPALHNSSYVTPDRYYVSATYDDRSHNHFSLFYEAWRGGYNYSYMYASDLNRDNYNYDAIYIPTVSDYNEGRVYFASEDDANRYFAFAKNDPYLTKHAGEYAEAYSIYNPWVHRVDFHYAHDFVLHLGRTSNTLQLNFDIKNLLNLFNDSWGVTKQMNPKLKSGRILDVARIASDGIPVLSTPDYISGSTETWTDVKNIGQVWYAQVGLKYLFNGNDPSQKYLDRVAAEADAEALAAAEAAARAARAAADKAVAEKNAAEAAANARIKALQDEIDALRNKAADNVKTDGYFDEPVIAYFTIGKSVLSATEVEHVKAAARRILAAGEKVKFTLAGHADSGTGSQARNEQLAKERVQTVYNLMKEMGVDAELFTVTSSVEDVFSTPEFNRCVIVDKQ